jgi:hypothetical protein
VNDMYVDLITGFDSNGDANEVRTTGKPKNAIRLNENRSWKLI